jgi:hypothetical protein
MMSIKSHGAFDYLIGAILLIAPWLFGLGDIPLARDILFVSGLVLIAYSLLTRYPYGALKFIPTSVHLVLDGIMGVFLIIAPVLFRFQESLTHGQFSLFVLLGMSTLALVALTTPLMIESKPELQAAQAYSPERNLSGQTRA